MKVDINKLFEEWAIKNQYRLNKYIDGAYKSNATNAVWIAWQAAYESALKGYIDFVKAAKD